MDTVGIRICVLQPVTTDWARDVESEELMGRNQAAGKPRRGISPPFNVLEKRKERRRKRRGRR